MTLGVLAVLSFAAAIALSLLAHQLGNGVIAAVIGLPCAMVGVLVSLRQRDNPLGWLFLAIGICLFLGTDGGAYAILGYRLGHHLPFGPVALALDQVWGPSLALFAVVVLLFPDGTLPSRFWRGALRIYCVLYAVLLAATAVAALFAPVRRRVQHAVDRRFNRARYDAERTVNEFAGRLQDVVDPDAVRTDLAGVVHAALEPTHVSVWLSR